MQARSNEWTVSPLRVISRHYRAGNSNGRFTAIRGHPKRCMFMLRTADKAAGGIATMPRTPPRRSAAVFCAERAEEEATLSSPRALAPAAMENASRVRL
jgi:hypothetical protein